MTLRPLTLARLLFRFMAHSVLSGMATSRIILKGSPPSSGFVKLTIAPMSTTGAAVLGALVTLTPGSSTIDIDVERRIMLLHLLDTRNLESSIAAIRRDFERDLAVLFPEK